MAKKKNSKRTKRGLTADSVSSWGKALKEWLWLIRLLILTGLAIYYKSPLFLLMQSINLQELAEKWFSR